MSSISPVRSQGPGRPKDLEKRAAILAAAKALRMNSALAAARIAARFSRSFGRPGPCDLTGEMLLMSKPSQNDTWTLLYALVQLFPVDWRHRVRGYGPGYDLSQRIAVTSGTS